MGGRNTYLKHDGGRWVWRRRVPQKLIARFGRGELVKSIGSVPHAEARRRARDLTVRSDELFDHVQNRPNLTPDEIAELARDFFERRLQGMETARTRYRPEDPDDLDQLEERARKHAAGARELVRINDLGTAAEPAHKLLADHGIHLAPDSPAMIELQRAILRANQAAHDVSVARMNGDYGATPEDPLLTQPQPQQSQVRQGTEPREPSPLLSTAWQRYTDEKVRSGAWRSEAQRDAHSAYKLFVEVVGDRPVTDYTRIMVGDFVDVIQRLPKMRGKDRRWRNKPIREVVAAVDGKEDVQLVSPTTVKKHSDAVASFFNWAIKKGLVEVNPASRVYQKPKTHRRRQDERQAWSPEQIQVLLESPIWQGCHRTQRSKPGEHVIRDARFWIPLIALYAPVRLEEVAQLRVTDIKHAEGIHYIDLNANEDDVRPRKKLKSAAAWRRIPLHAMLLDIGFIDYVSEVRATGAQRLFPELKAYGAGERFSWYFSKEFTKYIRRLGIENVSFHGLRHSAITALSHADVHPDLINRLDGHEISGERGRYTKDPSLVRLKTAVNAIKYEGVDADLIAGKRGSQLQR